jgi:hypothetical protein
LGRILRGAKLRHKCNRGCGVRGTRLTRASASPSGPDRPICLGQVEKGLLLESRAVRLPRWVRLARWLVVAFPVAVAMAPAAAQAQVNVTPNFSITPSSSVTKWIIWMALGAIILAVLILVGVGVSYLRFAPKFFGREEPPKRLPPGARPPLLARTGRPPAAVGATRPSVSQRPSAGTATAVATRPAPAATAPEAGSTAKTPEEVGAQPEEAVAQAPTTSEQAAAEQAPTSSEQAAGAEAPQPAAHGGASAMDQETFDRVLEEQLAKGVDRRVAEGRARAAAVVTARKKAQG